MNPQGDEVETVFMEDIIEEWKCREKHRGTLKSSTNKLISKHPNKNK